MCFCKEACSATAFLQHGMLSKGLEVLLGRHAGEGQGVGVAVPQLGSLQVQSLPGSRIAVVGSPDRLQGGSSGIALP